MAHQSKFTRFGAAAVAILFAGACADHQPTAPGSLAPRPQAPRFNVMSTVPGEVWLCPLGPAGSYSYSISVTIPANWTNPQPPGYSGTYTAAQIAAAQGNQVLDKGAAFVLSNPGTCSRIFHVTASINYNYGAGTQDAIRVVTITETGAPAGTSLDHIVSTWGNGGDVTTLGPTANVQVSMNDFHGAVAAYWSVPTGCTLTIGYWKNHAGLGRGNQADAVTPLLPVWLGTANGLKSTNVTTNVQAVSILGYDDDASNGIVKLKGQLLGAKLNIKAGAFGGAAAATILSSDGFLATHNEADWSGLSDTQQAQVLAWKDALDSWNNGLVGPPHCD